MYTPLASTASSLARSSASHTCTCQQAQGMRYRTRSARRARDRERAGGEKLPLHAKPGSMTQHLRSRDDSCAKQQRAGAPHCASPSPPRHTHKNKHTHHAGAAAARADRPTPRRAPLNSRLVCSVAPSLTVRFNHHHPFSLNPPPPTLTQPPLSHPPLSQRPSTHALRHTPPKLHASEHGGRRVCAHLCAPGGALARSEGRRCVFPPSFLKPSRQVNHLHHLLTSVAERRLTQPKAPTRRPRRASKYTPPPLLPQPRLRLRSAR